MRHLLIIPTALTALLLLTGCGTTDNAVHPTTPPTPSASSSVATPTTSPTQTITSTPVNVPTSTPTQRKLGSVSYHSGQANTNFTFTAPASGYKFIYTCNITSLTPADIKKEGVTTGYDEIINGTTIHRNQTIICDNEQHTLVAPAGTHANQKIKFIFTGDRMWISSISLTAFG